MKGLDGLRGLACLSVVCFHFFNNTFGNIIPFFNNIIFRFLFDGPLAISVFFIISGDVLSTAFITTEKREYITRAVIKRYPRLVIPILFSALLTYGMEHSGLLFNQEAGEILHRTDWLGSWVTSPPSLTDVLRYSFYDVFKSGKIESLNPFLWTMHYEIMGSVLIFILLYFYSFSQPYAGLLLIFVFLSVLNPQEKISMYLFLFGHALCVLRHKGIMSRINGTLFPNFLASTAIIAMFFLSILKPDFYFSGYFLFVKSVLFVMFIHCSNYLCTMMSRPLFNFLGNISFPLFLVQFHVLASFSSYFIVTRYTNHPTVVTAMMIAIASLFISIGAAILFWPTEAITKYICNLFYRIFERHVLKSSKKQLSVKT
ncbi:acyltransferase family protein [Acetobacter sp.]|uniref:acyltransferase family protein n=1 Tax=Acetobacter sp. TaxID=440 RepID=UPI0039EC1EEF